MVVAGIVAEHPVWHGAALHKDAPAVDVDPDHWRPRPLPRVAPLPAVGATPLVYVRAPRFDGVATERYLLGVRS